MIAERKKSLPAETRAFQILKFFAMIVLNAGLLIEMKNATDAIRQDLDSTLHSRWKVHPQFDGCQLLMHSRSVRTKRMQDCRRGLDEKAVWMVDANRCCSRS